MEFVDTHCHIQSSDKQSGDGGEAVTRRLWEKAGYPSGDQLIGRAVDAGVTRMICVGCSLPDSQLAVEFVHHREDMYASIGIHPHEAKDYVVGNGLDQTRLDQFAALATAPKVVAIGECGLDYYYEHSEPLDQQQLLRFQMELALEHDLPMIFHVRDAFADFWPIFDEYTRHGGRVRGVLHSFTDNQANLDKGLAYGLYVGVNGIATFAKNQEQLDMYKNIPLSRLLLETDSPFLTPSPYRGTICEPYHTSVTAEFLAGLRNEPLGTLAAATTANAHDLFNL
jgi:TatD DNase family protein